MSGKSDFFDYEPLRRPRRDKAVEGEEFPARTAQMSVSEFEARFDGEVKRNNATVTSDTKAGFEQAKAVNADTEPWVLKRGHLLSFVGLFMFTFLVFFRPYEFSPSLGWLREGAWVTALITLMFFIPTQLGLENRITIRPREVNLVLLLLILSLISVPFALDKFRAWHGFVDYSKVIVMFVVLVNVVRTEKRLKVLLHLILVASIILSVSAIKDYRIGNLALGGLRIEGAIGNLFDNPNDLALHLVSFIPIAIGLALGSRYLAAKIVYFALALTMLGGTVVTFSRGGFLGLIFVIGALVWKLGKQNRVLVAVVAALLVTVFLVLAPATYRERVSTTDDGSAETRKGDLKRSAYLALRHPFAGVGMSNYVLYSNTEKATHNSYTQVASELGIPAAVVYILFLIAAIKRLRRIPNPKEIEKRQRRIPYLAIGLHASLIGFMVTSFFASVAFLWYVYYLVGYAICVSRLWETSVGIQSKTLPPRV